MNQDKTAQKSRQMQGGKRGPVYASTFEDTDVVSLTYNGDNTVNTIVRTKTYADGTQWQKTITFGYTAGNLVSKTESLIQLVSGDDVDS